MGKSSKRIPVQESQVTRSDLKSFLDFDRSVDSLAAGYYDTNIDSANSERPRLRVAPGSGLSTSEQFRGSSRLTQPSRSIVAGAPVRERACWPIAEIGAIDYKPTLPEYRCVERFSLQRTSRRCQHRPDLRNCSIPAGFRSEFQEIDNPVRGKVPFD